MVAKNVPELRFPEFHDEWKEVDLGNIGSSYSGLSGMSKSDFGIGKSKYITYKSVFDNNIVDVNLLESVNLNNKKQNNVKKYDLFFTGSSETAEEAGMCAVLTQNIDSCYLNSFCIGYRLNNLKIHNSIFLSYYLRSPILRKKIMILAQGSTRFNISKTELMKLKVKIPFIGEQEKIAGFLSSLDEKIDLLTRSCEQWGLYKQEIMRRLFTQELRFPEFNDKWEEVKIKRIAHINPKSENLPEHFYYIDLSSVEKGQLKETYFISIKEAPSRAKHLLKKEDVLFQSVRPYQMNNLYFSEDNGSYVASNGYILLRTKENINPYYLYSALHLTNFVNNVLNRCTGTTYPAISTKDFKNLKIILPSLKEQEIIAGFLSSLDKKIELTEQQLEQTKQFKKAMLQKMFI